MAPPSTQFEVRFWRRIALWIGMSIVAAAVVFGVSYLYPERYDPGMVLGPVVIIASLFAQLIAWVIERRPSSPR